MADDWQAGDLALCVRKGRSYCDPTNVGAVYTVICAGWDMQGLPTIHFVGVPDAGPDFYGHNPLRFRKIRPHTPDAEDRETIALLNGAPVKEPVA